MFHRCDLLHFLKIFSVNHSYVRGGGSSCTYHESHNSGQYLHDTNFCPAAGCTQWPSADEITWLSSVNSVLTSLRALLIFLVIAVQNKGLNWRRSYQSNDSLTLRRLMSYIYGAPILDVSRSHTTTQHRR